MLTTFWSAPADLGGRGSVAVRPSLLGVVPVMQGSGLPVAGMAPRSRDRAVIGTGFGPALIQKTTTPITQNDEFTQNDGTTLGNHSPGRPRS